MKHLKLILTCCSPETAMDGVLEGATVLCVCKLASSLLFLPALAASCSPLGFCCCCLLIFTDFLLTVFLSFLSIFESWLTESSSVGDVVALRFLLVLSHTYGGVLLLIAPLIAVETLIRRLWPPPTPSHSLRGSDGQSQDVREVEEEEEEEKDRSSSHAGGFLCCLSVWVIVALNVQWRWKQEEVWAAVCLHTTGSLVRCLPKLLSSMPTVVTPCWGLTFLLLLFLLLLVTTGLQRHAGPVQSKTKHAEEHNDNDDTTGERGRPDLVPVCVNADRVDPEKTQSSCTVHTVFSWKSLLMSESHHRDFVLVSPVYVSGKMGGQEDQGRTKRALPLTFTTLEHVESARRRRGGFPCPGVNVTIASVGVLSIFVLPLYLSVNILLIRTVETLLEVCIDSLVSSSASTGDTASLGKETLV